MTAVRTLILAAAFAAFFMPGDLAAQVKCYETKAVEAFLNRNFKEAPDGQGLVDDGRIIELWRSRDGATWTLVARRTDGLSCLLAGGEHWENVIWFIPPEERES